MNSTRQQLKNFESKIAVVDNNVLVDLHELGWLDLLFRVFKGVAIPKLIFDRGVGATIICMKIIICKQIHLKKRRVLESFINDIVLSNI
jgi:hypothetical protein